MEQLNRIEIRGIVGSVYVKDFRNAKVANFSVATSYAYRSHDDTPVIETTWHRVVAWQGEGICDLTQLRKGTAVHVTGRLRLQKYTGSDGIEKAFCEIVANKVEIA